VTDESAHHISAEGLAADLTWSCTGS
jgi:hypothetical protein